jgi:hypothetical protein
MRRSAQLRRFAGSTFAIAVFNDIPLATLSRIARTSDSSCCACSTRCCHESAEMRDLTRTSSAATGSYTFATDHVGVRLSISFLLGSRHRRRFYVEGCGDSPPAEVPVGANARASKLINTDLEGNGAFQSGPCYAAWPSSTHLCADAMIWGNNNVFDNVQWSQGVVINGDDNLLAGGIYSNIQILAAADRTRLRDLKYGGTCSDYPVSQGGDPGADGIPYTNCGAITDGSGTGSTEWSGISYYWTGNPLLPDSYAKPPLGTKPTVVTHGDLTNKLSTPTQPNGVFFYCSDCSASSGLCVYGGAGTGRLATRIQGQWRCN